MQAGLRELAVQVSRIAEDAGKHALKDQLMPKDLVTLNTVQRDYSRGLKVDDRLSQFIYNRLTYIDPFKGRWEDRTDEWAPGDRYWCVGGVDGVINYSRSMAEWSVTISLFEFNEFGSAQPILGVIHAPALNLTYLAARQQARSACARHQWGEAREDHAIHSQPPRWLNRELRHVVCAAGGTTCPQCGREPRRQAADIKRIGPVSLDVCKVADGTYDATSTASA